MASLLSVVPNWGSGVRDTYTFNTSVFTTRDGHEQRRSLMLEPRRTISATVLLDGSRRRAFIDDINRARDGKVEICDYTAQPAVARNPANAGDPYVVVASLPYWAVDGAVICAVVNRLCWRMTISHVTSGAESRIYVLPTVTTDIPPGAFLRPVLPGMLAPTTTTTVLTADVNTADLEVRIDPGTPMRQAAPVPFVSGGPSTQIYDGAGLFWGRYVLLRKPQMLSPPQVEFAVNYEEVDYGRGVSVTFAPVPMVLRTLTATYLGLDIVGVFELIDIFTRARGRAGEIYVPTWGSDFPTVKAVSGSTITFAGTTIYSVYRGDPAHKAVLLRTTTDVLKPFEIASIASVDGDSVVTFDQPIGVSAAQIDRISWMFVARFASDSLTVEWVTDGVANVTFSFVTLYNLPVENAYGSNWILATGFWRDTGQWEDTASWNDA